MQALQKKVSLYWHTLRYLKPIQIYWRLWIKLYQPKPHQNFPSPTVRQRTKDLFTARLKISSYTPPNSFNFLNQTHELQTASDWNNPSQEKLWLYNLHYFDDLNALDADNRVNQHQRLIQRWINENPPAHGNGWEPYPTSLRIVNWIKWLTIHDLLETDALNSLITQASHLNNRLEYHLLGNHLFANAKALIYAGLFFEGNAAKKWLESGLKILNKELKEQILDDGGHFELSPMYHCIILEDMLDLVNLANCYDQVIETSTIRSWQETASKMLHWLQTVQHPDGEISLFNDAAFGIAATPAKLFSYAQALGITLPYYPNDDFVLLKESGYARLQKGKLTLLADVGNIGPDYLPGHAHADTLTFELSLDTQRIIVDSGTSCYGNSPERLCQRATPAHNTITVNNQNSSEVWEGFRVARRARPLNIKHSSANDTVLLSAAHDGYRRLSKDIIHRRTWQLSESNLTIKDEVVGRWQNVTGHLLFAPELSLHPTSDTNTFILNKDEQNIAKITVNNVKAIIRKSTYHPRFGEQLDCQQLRYDLFKGSPKCAITIMFDLPK